MKCCGTFTGRSIKKVNFCLPKKFIRPVGHPFVSRLRDEWPPVEKKRKCETAGGKRRGGAAAKVLAGPGSWLHTPCPPADRCGPAFTDKGNRSNQIIRKKGRVPRNLGRLDCAERLNFEIGAGCSRGGEILFRAIWRLGSWMQVVRSNRLNCV